MTLLAFHNDPRIQAKYLNRVEAHYQADEFIHGTYWEHGKGCAVGCTIHGADHTRYETELGIPVALAHLEDRMFEAQRNGQAKEWPLAFLTVIPLGADLSGVVPQFMAWMMDDPTYGVATTTTDPELKTLALEVAQRYRTGEGLNGPAADTLTAKLTAKHRDALDARTARTAWDAWDARTTRDAWIEASASELLRLLADAPVPKSALIA